jgi:hypothetical protein
VEKEVSSTLYFLFNMGNYLKMFQEATSRIPVLWILEGSSCLMTSFL